LRPKDACHLAEDRVEGPSVFEDGIGEDGIEAGAAEGQRSGIRRDRPPVSTSRSHQRSKILIEADSRRILVEDRREQSVATPKIQERFGQRYLREHPALDRSFEAERQRRDSKIAREVIATHAPEKRSSRTVRV
jgi:hypothetical protein